MVQQHAYPKFHRPTEPTAINDTTASGHSDVAHTTTGGMNGVPSIGGLRNNPNEDTAIWTMELRRRMNITQTALSERLGVSPALVGQWERGTGRPSKLMTTTVLLDLAREYHMPDPPQGGDAWTKVGPRFAAGLSERFVELFGEK